MIAVLMTCFNRRETTLRCLRSLCDEVEKVGGGGQWKVDIFLVDDGCTDGTSAAVREQFPFVKILQTGGGFYWAKGMELAWQNAISHVEHGEHVEYDGFLWLNDDVTLKPEAFSTLLHFYMANPSSVIVGELVNAKGEVTYGKRGDLFTGNFVYVPREVYEKVGMICGAFHHAWADSDYAMRCKRSGVPMVSCGVVGTCEGHPNRPSLRGLSLKQRWAMLSNPKGWCVHDLWLYRVRNWGYCAAIWSCVHLIFHVLKGEQ